MYNKKYAFNSEAFLHFELESIKKEVTDTRDKTVHEN